MRYSGKIPKQITNAIRTGLLQCVAIDVLLPLVASLIGKDVSGETLAIARIEEIARYPKERLLDGGSWLEDTYQHKDGSRYL